MMIAATECRHDVVMFDFGLSDKAECNSCGTRFSTYGQLTAARKLAASALRRRFALMRASA